MSDPTPTDPTPASSDKTELSPELQAEIEAAMSELAPEQSQHAPKIRGPRVVESGREHRKGTVVSVGDADVFLEFGPKELGVVERIQFKDNPPEVGSELEVVVLKFEANEGLYLCGLPGSVTKSPLEQVQPGEVVEARVTGVNKGGLELDAGAYRAFMPASQVSLDRIEDLSILVGEKMAVQVQRVDRRGKGNVVVSRRAVLEVEREKAREEMKQSLKEGDVLEGVVSRVADFGAFVDIGGVDGLVHISDLSHERVGHGQKAVERHLNVGDKVNVQILKIDWDRNRISLGVKQLQQDPFEAVGSEIVEGAEVSGRVTRLADFGAFVEVARGVEGLVHISELDHRRVGHPSDVLKEDEIVKVKVLKVDPQSRKISLSVKSLKEAPASSGRGGRGGQKDSRSADEILKDTPALRRMREKFGKQGFKGGLG